MTKDEFTKRFLGKDSSGKKKFNWFDIGSWFGHNNDSPVEDAINTYSGKTEKDHLNRADQLAEEEFQFQKQYSAESLEEQRRQFELNYGQAQSNIDFQKDIAEKNFALQQDAFNAQLKENELTRQREDTAYQRQIADLKAAGFSPLMASNGAAAAAQSVGSAPQYDSSAVATTQGSAVQLANDYAQLLNMARGQYLSRRQEARNQQIAAQMALSQLGATRRQNFQNLALEGANLSMNIRDMKKKHEYIDEQINALREQTDWNKKNGWRNQGLQNYLLNVLKNVLPEDKAGELISNTIKGLTGSESIEEVVDSLKEKVESAKNLPNSAKKAVQDVIDDLGGKNQEFTKTVKAYTENNVKNLRKYALTGNKKYLLDYYQDNYDLLKENGITINDLKELSRKEILIYGKRIINQIKHKKS